MQHSKSHNDNKERQMGFSHHRNIHWVFGSCGVVPDLLLHTQLNNVLCTPQINDLTPQIRGDLSHLFLCLHQEFTSLHH